MYRLIIPLLLAQSDADDMRLRIAVQLELMRLQQAKVVPAPKRVVKTYAELFAESIDRGVPFVVGVGCTPPRGFDWVSASVDLPWEGRNRPVVVVGIPKGKSVYEAFTLPPGATWDDVYDAIADYNGRRILERLRQRSDVAVPRSVQC